MIVKAGDKHAVQWRVNMDLTGATVRLVAQPLKPYGTPALVLASSVADAEDGVVEHTLSGELPVGVYRVEVEVSSGSDVITFPNDSYVTLEVIRDLD